MTNMDSFKDLKYSCKNTMITDLNAVSHGICKETLQLHLVLNMFQLLKCWLFPENN